MYSDVCTLVASDVSRCMYFVASDVSWCMYLCSLVLYVLWQLVMFRGLCTLAAGGVSWYMYL